MPLVAQLLQHRDWGEIARLTGHAGRAEVIQLLR